MKGLIKNNFYSVLGSIKTSMVAILIINAIFIMLKVQNPENDFFITAAITATLGSFGSLTGTAIQKDTTSKWNKFELTMPINRKDVIKARYISAVLYLLIGLAIATISIIAFSLITGPINLERVAYGLVFGVAFAVSVPTFSTPLTLILGHDKIESILFITMGISIGLFFLVSYITSELIGNVPTANTVFRVGYIILILLMFIASYIFSKQLYQKKEL